MRYISTKTFPVISGGWDRPINFSTVGATSPNTPLRTLLTRSDTTIMGTGFNE